MKKGDTRLQGIAYVPVGSIAKGEALVTTGGNGKTLPCGKCHGNDLRGLGPIPGIAGRSPSYLTRQTYDMKYGARAGLGSKMMTSVVAELKEEDVDALAVYVASLKP